MLAFYLSDSDTKKFMNILFKEASFDRFEIREASVNSFVKFEVTGMLSKSAVSSFAEDERRFYALWSEIKPFILNCVRGRAKPETMKIVFSGGARLVSDIHPNAAAVFLNMVYENGAAHFTAATSQKEFSMNRELDLNWEEHVRSIFRNLDMDMRYNS